LEEISTAELRRRILRDRGLLPPQHRKPTDSPDLLPEEFPMTPRMKYIEVRYEVKVKIDIFKGSLNEVCQRYNWEVDRSTISRWRKYIRRFLVNS